MSFRGDWQPQYVQYNLNDVVKYQDGYYKIIQAHKSQADWPPSTTAALWSPVSDDSSYHNAEPKDQPPAYSAPAPLQVSATPRPGGSSTTTTGGHKIATAGPIGRPFKSHITHASNSGQQVNDTAVYRPTGTTGFAPKPNGGYTLPDGGEVEGEEAKKPWYEVDDETKRKVLAAGGLALGLGLLAGIKYMKNKSKGDGGQQQQQGQQEHVGQLEGNTGGQNHPGGSADEAQAWELQNWYMGAKQHTDDFLREGPKGPVTWIVNDALEERKDLKENLIEAGEEEGRQWFIARAQFQGSLQLGKCCLDRGENYAFIGFGNEAIRIEKFEALIGDSKAIKWVHVNGRFEAKRSEFEPVGGGHNSNGSPIFVARTQHKGSIQPGKCSEAISGCYFCYGTNEEYEEEYEVLCLRGSSR